MILDHLGEGCNNGRIVFLSQPNCPRVTCRRQVMVYAILLQQPVKFRLEFRPVI